MKSLALQKCWDEVRLVSKMASDLRYELETMKDELKDIAENCGPFRETEHDAKIAAKQVKKFIKKVKEVELITDKWANENSPF